MHDNTLTDDNRDKFSYIAGQYNQSIKFYNVEKICANEIEEIKKLFAEQKDFEHYTIGAMFRLLTPQLLSNDIEKVIYLDADTIVNLDIREFWQVSLEDKPIAALPETENGINTEEFFLSCKEGIVDPNEYFNSGVVVLNLKIIRKNELENIREKMVFRAKNPQYTCFDQEILNYCFSKNYVKLSSRFNFFVHPNRIRGNFNTKNCILHYAGSVLNLNMRDPFNRLWFSYFKKTPWFNEDVIAHVYEELVRFNVQQKDFAIQTSVVVSGKIRIFFTAEDNIDTLAQIFYIKEDEEIVPFVDMESIQILKDCMKRSAGNEIYFIFIGNYYPIVRAELIKEGFVEGRDFLDAMQFLSEAHGVPLNTYNFVKAL